MKFFQEQKGSLNNCCHKKINTNLFHYAVLCRFLICRNVVFPHSFLTSKFLHSMTAKAIHKSLSLYYTNRFHILTGRQPYNQPLVIIAIATVAFVWEFKTIEKNRKQGMVSGVIEELCWCEVRINCATRLASAGSLRASGKRAQREAINEQGSRFMLKQQLPGW